MMRSVIALCYFLPSLCLAAAPPPALADLADRARSLPAEFAADALLRLADAPQAPDAAWKRALIQEAFERAAAAQQPYARRAWLESHDQRWGRAFAQGLDACTLQCRAVHAMLALDRKQARTLFAGIAPPNLPRLSCEDPLVYDDSIFYATLGELAQVAFTRKEIADEEPLHLLQRFAAGMTSPVETGAVARMIAGAPLPPAQLAALTSSFAGALPSLPDDDRSFSAGTAGQADVAALAQLCVRQQVSPAPLLEAWRAYLVRHLSGTRCADTTRAEPLAVSFAMPSAPATANAYAGPLGAAQFFNEKMRAGDLRAIAGDEVRPAKTEGEARAIAPCESTDCKQLGEQFSKLLLGPVGLSYTEEQKAGGEWGAKLKEYLSALAGWKSADDPAECFHWKTRYYSDLLNVVPSGLDRDTVLAALLNWLQLNGYQRDHRAEWFYPVNGLIIRAFADPQVMRDAIAGLRKSPDPVMALYAQLEQMLPRPLDRTVGLL